MAIPLKTRFDAENRIPFINAAPSTANGQVVVHEQLNAAIQGLGWKDNCRVASTVNITIASPGATIDAITMVSGDRVLAKNQTTVPENGIYVWNGAATPMTRALDADTFDKMESAVVVIDEGTAGAGTTWRQTQVNGVIGTNNVIWGAFGTAAPLATETQSGTVEIATQAETDAGVVDGFAVTPLKLANWAGRPKKFQQTFGDGSATSYVITHNLNTVDLNHNIYETGGLKRAILCEAQQTTVNSMTLVFDVAPALNSLRIFIDG